MNTKDTQRETLRTDWLAFETDTGHEVVSAESARELERELATAKEALRLIANAPNTDKFSASTAEQTLSELERVREV